MMQWIRQCSLLIANKNDALDLSQQRIVFTVKKTQNETPNQAQIKIFNLEKTTENKIISEGQRVILQAGYKENSFVIFDGDITQIKKGRDAGTDSYVEMLASDGDASYNYAVVNTSFAAGSTQKDHIAAASSAMGLASGQVDANTASSLLRGKALFGPAKDILRQSSQANNQNWSIQNGQLQVINKNSLLATQAIFLNSQSGLIVTPEQTSKGIKAKCLLNPLLKIGGKVIINEENIALEKIKSDSKKEKPEGKPATIAKDGAYKIISIEFSGDTFGSDWASDLICIDVDAIVAEEEL